jgi:glyoxylase-like metal-dependent hydrolase (beta-lactamase superfamily II)
MTLTRIGEFAIDRVVELEFPAFIAREFFPACTEAQLADGKARLGNLISADDKLRMSFHSFVVRTPKHTILIDTCCGNHKPRPARADFSMMQTNYLADLAAQGVKPEQVDYVMCTHLHWDHVGWNTCLQDGKWVPTFPNAKHIMARREYEFWDAEYAKGDKSNMHVLAFEDSVLPIKRAEQAVLVDDDFELEKGLWLEPCPGHTPGLVLINVEGGGKRGVFVGDAIHHQLQFLYPDLSCRADTDMALSAKSRRAFLEQHAETDTIVMPAHFPMPTAGTVVRDRNGFGFKGV